MAKKQPDMVVTRSDYGIDQVAFITAWETSETTDEVYIKLAALSRVAGNKPMPRPIMAARAARYRAAGVQLKKFKPGPPTIAGGVEAANRLIEQLRAGQSVGVEAPQTVAPPPPHKDTGKVIADIVKKKKKK